VRLKVGNPFAEIEPLRLAGVSVEVVPGVPEIEHAASPVKSSG
jgi:precorrin-4 methylase